MHKCSSTSCKQFGRLILLSSIDNQMTDAPVTPRSAFAPITPPGGAQPPTPDSILTIWREQDLWTVQLMALKYTNSFFAKSVAKLIVPFI